jgi:hypothetical protein
VLFASKSAATFGGGLDVASQAGIVACLLRRGNCVAIAAELAAGILAGIKDSAESSPGSEAGCEAG